MEREDRLEQAQTHETQALVWLRKCGKALEQAEQDVEMAERELRDAREATRVARYAVGQRDTALRGTFLRPDEADTLTGDEIEDIYGIPDEQGCIYVPDALLTAAQRETWARWQDERAQDAADPFARDEGRRA